MKRILPILALAASAALASAETAPLELSAMAETPLILHGTTSAHVLVRLRAAATPADAEAKSLNLALVIDRSGSMSGPKIADARDAAIQMLDRMRDGDRVAVVSYSDEVRVDAESTVLTEDSRKRIREAIHGISDDGSTNLGGGLVEGLNQIRAHRGTSEVNRVLLISDGLANRGITDPRELNRIAREALQDGLIATTIGLGADYNEDLMTALADHGGGNYYFIEKSAKIAATLNDEIRQMASTVARNVALVVSLPEGLTLDTVHGWVPRQEAETVIVPLGEFFSGQLRSVLWRFTLPADLKPGDEVRLGPVDLTFNGLGEDATLIRLSSDPVTLTVSENAGAVASARNVEVAARVAEIELATSMEAAANLVADQKYDEAKALLQNASVRAREQGAILPAPLAADLLSAADAATQMESEVDQAALSTTESRVLTKTGKAASQMLKKK